jgi:AraC-like DNA-binding protein
VSAARISGHASSAYGPNLARKFGADDGPAVVTRPLQHAAFAATEIRVDHPQGAMSEALQQDDAYLLCLTLRETPDFSYWEEGREFARYFHAAGRITISDMRRQPSGRLDKPIHSLVMYLPRSTMNALAEEAHLPPVENLCFEPGADNRDDIIQGLGLSLLPALRTPERANRLYTDHVALALAAQVAYAYGGQQIARQIRGGLTPWQERRAKDMILGNLAGDASISDIATACGLSPGYFSRAFRKTTGFTPHAWLLRARVQRAAVLLRRDERTLASIARACGFADRSHFSHAFTRHTGVTPSIWRRLSMR